MSVQRSVTVDDAQMVLWSADILEKTEFEVFEMAYQAWFREPPDTARLERVFAVYMFDGVAPFWVRQFTRSTLGACDGWSREDETEVWEYVVRCTRAAAAATMTTLALAVSLFLPEVAFPRVDCEPQALPA